MGNTMRGIITFIPSERIQQFLVGELKELPLDRTLDLSNRQLRRLPVSTCVFEELLKLYLSDNKLSSLPHELNGLRNLQLLALDFNSFEEFPEAVCRLSQLSILYLGNNRLYSLPDELNNLKELNTLWLEANCFTVFPKVISVGEGVKRVGRWADCPDPDPEEDTLKVTNENRVEAAEGGQPDEEHQDS
uniref:Disease resistance R13L4/SHOC-2-like LRR domain-containing protein n=1 Tax=Knipowitschia caucasica TaxID=637954 RepID=A0AAV2L540_KNICA